MAPSINFSTDDAALDRAILARLARLRSGSSLCPGRLARDLGLTQAQLRPHLARLEQSGFLSIRQNRRPASLASLRGPYRVAPTTTTKVGPSTSTQ